MPRITPALRMEAGDQQQIEKWWAAQRTLQQVALRSRIVLAAGEGRSDSTIAESSQINRRRYRLAEQGLGSRWAIAPGRSPVPLRSLQDQDYRGCPLANQ